MDKNNAFWAIMRVPVTFVSLAITVWVIVCLCEPPIACHEYVVGERVVVIHDLESSERNRTYHDGVIRYFSDDGKLAKVDAGSAWTGANADWVPYERLIKIRTIK